MFMKFMKAQFSLARLPVTDVGIQLEEMVCVLRNSISRKGRPVAVVENLAFAWKLLVRCLFHLFWVKFSI